MQPHKTASRQTVSVDLEARQTQWEPTAGVAIPAYGFNGQVPGPTIQAEVGDTLVVRLANNLPEPTTIHWHGLRVPANTDGTEMVRHPVQPGDGFEYRFVLPDAGPSGTTPHPRDRAAREGAVRGAHRAGPRRAPGG